ncbi:type VII secretion protein EccB [Streptomyces bluensis]|uniref:Type VII secretion protein EccB n=1 Tax=Streptomyces bluensis TaxID=33897 RepID=A0ABW6UGD7_9ACTN|nr:type VII secretion protein EccB [Streptomyces bluensis]GGZ90996.1 hypothetical protein GCM10010344_68250 [Streptomyces bluensis]
MQNKRDQVQAHMFLMGRLTSSMLRSDPDAPESPQGRTNRGVAIGVIVALLVAAGAFVIGLFLPGKQDSWRTSGDLIVDKDTGARYLYLDGRLRPVRNYASALLLAGADLATTTVSNKSLKDTPHGTPVGIVGAPDELPEPGDLSDAPWQVCSASPDDGTSGTKPVTTLAVSNGAGGDGLGKSEGMLVAGPDGTRYLLWQGSRLRLDRTSGAQESLGYASTAPVPVSAAFLSALPAGPDLTPPSTPGIGGSGALPGGASRVGQVYKLAVPGGEPRYYLLREDGLAPLTQTEVALVLGDKETREKAYGGQTPVALELTSDDLRGRLAPGSEQDKGPAVSPENPPQAVAVGKDQVLCAEVTPQDEGTRVGLRLTDVDDLGTLAQHASGAAAAACLPVERITVPPGRGALVRPVGAGGAQVGGTVYLVTSTGVKYRLTSKEAVTAFGYEAVSPLQMPSLTLAMLPSGPDLYPEAAVRGRADVTAPRCAWQDKRDK